MTLKCDAEHLNGDRMQKELPSKIETPWYFSCMKFGDGRVSLTAPRVRPIRRTTRTWEGGCRIVNEPLPRGRTRMSPRFANHPHGSKMPDRHGEAKAGKLKPLRKVWLVLGAGA
jgi:hypothetical protein